VHEEFVNNCRENKFIVRDFAFSEENIHTQREELETADVTEKELWVSRS
jgi:V-type H+-transporting ATPase subunit C